MMKVRINGVEENTDYSGDTLGNFLEQIQKTRVLPGTYISKLLLNGKVVEVDAATTRSVPVTKIETLEIEIVGVHDILQKNIDNAENYLGKLIPGIGRAAELFQLENEQEASKFFLGIVDGIDWFTNVMDGILNVLTVAISPHQFNGKTIQERQDLLIDMTKQLLEANERKDWVLVADLLEYEFAPYYKDWLSIFPELKRMAQETMN